MKIIKTYGNNEGVFIPPNSHNSSDIVELHVIRYKSGRIALTIKHKERKDVELPFVLLKEKEFLDALKKIPFSPIKSPEDK